MCERTDVTTVRRSTPPPLELASALRGRCRLLTSGLYMGHAHFNRRERTSKAGTRFRPASEWIPIAVPALVSEDTFRTAQAQLAQNRDRQSGASRRGSTSCMASSDVGIPSHGHRIYRCAGRDRLTGDARCRAAIRTAEPRESLV